MTGITRWVRTGERPIFHRVKCGKKETIGLFLEAADKAAQITIPDIGDMTQGELEASYFGHGDNAAVSLH